MKRFISLMVVALLAMPTIALAGRGFKHGFKHGSKHGFKHGFGHMNPVVVKKALQDAGCSDQQIRRIEILKNETERKTLDIRHEMEKARMDMKQMMQADNPDRVAIFKQLDKIAAVQLRLNKACVGLILDVRKEVTPEQWEKLQLLKAEHKMKHRKKMRKRFKSNQP